MMPSESGGERMSRAELTAFAQKVEDWGRSLSLREQEFLTELIARAASVEQPDVQGYAVNLNSSKSNAYKSQPPADPLPIPVSGSLLTLEFLSSTFLRIYQ